MATKEEEISSLLNPAKTSKVFDLVHEDNLRSLIEDLVMHEETEEGEEELEFVLEEAGGSGERARSEVEFRVGVAKSDNSKMF
ncbi:hypothetical protein RRG08_014936 [Elysia crispata]|uniref:Uncharacterized protein n=1 Tax=Elysia crispata TaxID=231223 RepID=A0AAE1E8Z6_9GAST|nr:hypothetical protein RRG08_014936 [Elysia crispata]